jgi:hypothetical protein
MAGPWEQYQTESGPWSRYGAPKPVPEYKPGMFELGLDISSARSDPWYEQLAKGAAIGLRGMGKGIKGLVSELEPADIAEIEAMKRYQSEAGWPATVGRIAAEAPAYMAGAGLGPATMLGRAATAAGTAATISPEDRLRSAGEAALGSYVGEGLVGGLGKIMRGPVAQKGVAELFEEGVRPTAAQAIGGAVKTAEEKLESVPLIGAAITKAHRRGMETFNTATLKKVVDDLNREIDAVSAGVPSAPGQAPVSPMQRIEVGDIQPGTTGFQQVKSAVKEAYGRLVENTSGEMTPELQAGLQGIRDLAGTLRGSYAKQIDDILKNTIESRLKPGQRVDGVTIKEIDSELTNLAENYTKSSIADERRIGQAIQEAQRQMHLMMEGQNPDYATALRNADSAYFKLKRIEQATTSSVANELMTPAQLLQSLRGRDRTGFAQGTMPMQEWGRAAQEVLGNKYPDSGTAGRLGLGDLFAAGVGGLPKAAAFYFGAQGAYSPAVQDFLVQQALKQPGPARQAAVRGLSALRQPASATGASFATGY